MSKQAFISRKILPESEFSRILGAESWTVYGQSLVALTPVAFSEVPSADWVFFSSGHAARFFFEGGGHAISAQWAAIGEGTARSLAKYVPTIDFIGNGNPSSAAAAFLRVAQGQRVLFPGARQSRHSIQVALKTNITAINFSVYDNQPVLSPSPRTEQVLAFTSPMNVQAYFTHHALQNNQQVVAIGNSTAEALMRQGIREITVAADASERGLAEAVLSLRV
jgi:uroporphyrinogen-III synthase